MYLPPDLVLRRINIGVIAALASLFFLRETVRELDPLAGRWEPVRVVINGKPQPAGEAKVVLDIADGRADMLSSWSCGAVCDTFAKGDMVVDGSDIALYGVNKGDRERFPTPAYHLERLESGLIGFRTTFGEGKPVWIEFKRRENVTTTLDYLGWR